MKVGDKIKDGYQRVETILKIEPYTGRYMDAFDCFITITHPHSRSRTSRLAYNMSNYERDGATGRC